MISVWVTRAEPGASATAARLTAMGFAPIVAPLLAARVRGRAAPGLAGVAALAFTSAAGVRAFAALSPARDLQVFAVGAATAEAARQAGFARVEASAGDVGALAAFIAARRETLAGAVLHPGAREPAGDLVGDLARLGVAGRRAIVYETVETRPVVAALAPALKAPFVLLHSAKAAGALARLLGPSGAPGLQAVCLSPAIGRPLAGAGLGGVEAAPSPDETALLARLAVAAKR